MSDLEPDVGMRERTWRVSQNSVEASQGVLILALLFVNDAKSKKNFVGFVKV